MDPGVAVCATIVGAFVAGVAGGLLASQGLQGVAAGVAVVTVFAGVALMLVGLYGFMRRPRRRH
jgi:hypothetical protein